MIKAVVRYVYYILIGVVVVGALGGYLNFLADRDSKMWNYYEQQRVSRESQ